MTPENERSPAPVKPTITGGRGAWLAVPALLAAAAAFLISDRIPRGTPAAGPGHAGIAMPALAGEATKFTDEQRKDIEKIIKDYLIANPELFLEIQAALEAKFEKEQAEKTKAAIAENAKDLYRHPNAAVAGNPNGDITVVEFFDYNCGYCKRAFGDIAKLVEKDKNVRVVLAELPIIRDESEPVSRIALAAKLQGKYWELHRELISTKGTVTESVALKLAEKVNLDLGKLKTDMNSSEVKGELERIKALAKKMGISGTPHFLVGDRTIGGAPEHLLELLEGHLAEVRKSGCNYC